MRFFSLRVYRLGGGSLGGGARFGIQKLLLPGRPGPQVEHQGRAANRLVFFQFGCGCPQGCTTNDVIRPDISAGNTNAHQPTASVATAVATSTASRPLGDAMLAVSAGRSGCPGSRHADRTGDVAFVWLGIHNQSTKIALRAKTRGDFVRAQAVMFAATCLAQLWNKTRGPSRFCILSLPNAWPNFQCKQGLVYNVNYM